MSPTHRLTALVLAAALGLSAVSSAQRSALPAPRRSPPASVTGTVGVTEVTVDYSRPGVRGRSVWGDLVPYGAVWRAGANAATRVTFTSDVKVAGETVPAGTYSYHVLPFRDRPWNVMLNGAAEMWGSYSYDKTQDVVRIEVTPVDTHPEEWMRFDVSPVDDTHSSLDLIWAGKRISLPLQVDLEVSQAAAVRELLDGPGKDNPELLVTAARGNLKSGQDLEQALEWAARAAELQKTFDNLGLQAQLLEALGRKDEAAPLQKQAWLVATEEDLSNFGGKLMSNRQYAQAVPVFELSARKNPESWKAHDQLAEAYKKSGEKDKAMKAYAKALELTDDDAARERLEATLEELRGA